VKRPAVTGKKERSVSGCVCGLNVMSVLPFLFCYSDTFAALAKLELSGGFLFVCSFLPVERREAVEG
jgi:hypothetical protein